MYIRVSSIEEHSGRIQRVVDGRSEVRRPVSSVTIEFKFESGGLQVAQKTKGSRGFNKLMNDGHAYRLRTQLDGFAWVSVTYRLGRGRTNPYGATTTDKLVERALAAVKAKAETLVS